MTMGEIIDSNIMFNVLIRPILSQVIKFYYKILVENNSTFGSNTLPCHKNKDESNSVSIMYEHDLITTFLLN